MTRSVFSAVLLAVCIPKVPPRARTGPLRACNIPSCPLQCGGAAVVVFVINRPDTVSSVMGDEDPHEDTGTNMVVRVNAKEAALLDRYVFEEGFRNRAEAVRFLIRTFCRPAMPGTGGRK